MMKKTICILTASLLLCAVCVTGLAVSPEETGENGGRVDQRIAALEERQQKLEEKGPTTKKKEPSSPPSRKNSRPSAGP
jgi:hypothetical protein